MELTDAKIKAVISQQKIAKVFFQPYTFTNNQSRVFYGNSIYFRNQGTGNVFINNVYLIEPGDDLSIGCDQNEIDMTTYQISFAVGFTNRLGVWVKMNEGINSLVDGAVSKMVAPVSKRKGNKSYEERRKRGKF